MATCINTFVTLVLCNLLVCGYVYADLDLVILHTNDVHARIEEFTDGGGPCPPADAREGTCFGGVARRMSAIKEVREQYDNVLLLDAGDQWQGTPWFYFYEGMEAAHFMNLLKYDAMAFGQHEFEFGVSGLQPFLKNLNFPVVCCNVDSSAETETPIQDLYVPYTVIEIGGDKVGIIGFAYAFIMELVSPAGISNIRFLDEVTEMQKAVNKLLEEEDVNKIIGVGSMDLLEAEEVAANVEGLDVLVCGDRTHLFLYSGDPPSTDVPYGEYPYVVNSTFGGEVPIVQASEYGKYLGFLKVNFNDDGEVTAWEGNPILLNSSVLEDPEVLVEVNKLKGAVVEFTGEVLANTRVLLNGDRFSCRLQECSFGNLLTDAMLSIHLINSPTVPGAWSDTSIAIWQSGGIRASAGPGDVHYQDVLDAFPFQNTIVSVQTKGSVILEVLEHSVDGYDPTSPHAGPGRFLQMSGIKVEYDVTKPPGSRVQRARVRCSECQIPTFEELDVDKEYGILLSDYLQNGGDGYTMLRDESSGLKHLGGLARDVIADYIKARSPVTITLEGRIVFCADGKCTREVRPCGAAMLSTSVSMVMTLAFLVAILP